MSDSDSGSHFFFLLNIRLCGTIPTNEYSIINLTEKAMMIVVNVAIKEISGLGES